MVKTMPGSIACMLPIITCGASWTSRPRPWPVLVSTRSAKPDARRLSVTRRSSVSSVIGGAAMLRPSSLAARTAS